MTRRTAVTIAALFAASVIALGASQEPDRSKPPVTGPPPALKLPAIDKAALSTGLPVWIVEQHDVPLVQVNVIVKSGSAADPAGKYGVAGFASAMLDEGAGSRDALDLADAVAFLGAQLSTASTFDQSSIRLSVPVAKLGDALGLLADVTIRPTFSDREMERLRKERLTQLLQAADDPSALVSFAFPRAVFGRDHRYGTTAFGTETSLRALSREDLQTFYRQHYRANNATILVVGDTDRARVLPLLEQAFGSWKPVVGAATTPAVPPPAQLTSRHVYLVDKPGAAQSQVRMGWVGVPRSAPDIATLDVMNTVLGGSFTSRLNTNLREEHGYSYGAFSAFDRRLQAGPFYAGAAVQTDKTAEALREFVSELEGMRQPVASEELEKAKNYVALKFPGEFETNGDLARKLEDLIVYDLPADTYATYIERVRQVSQAEVRAVAERFSQPGRFAIVVVGDLKVVEAPIRALGLGTITVMTPAQLFQ